MPVKVTDEPSGQPVSVGNTTRSVEADALAAADEPDDLASRVERFLKSGDDLELRDLLPKGLSRAGNNGLYNGRGLGVAKKSLRPGGVLGVWSSTPDHALTGRLQRYGFEVKETMVRAHRGRGARHIVWMAATPG